MGGASSSIPFRIPPRLDEKLGKGALGNEVRATLTRFHAWIGEPRFQLFLFPEYTDHGPEHVNRVLASAEWLITEESWPLLTEQDAAVLCLATLLHDAAMHLPGDGFVALLKQVDRPRIELFDSLSWAQLFEDFCSEARRWDDRKLYRILGDQTKKPEEQRDLAAIMAGLREKAHDPERWDLGDRKLLGEFLRRHHARLAHEIARFGVPAPVAGAPSLNSIPEGLADLAGLVARSHSLALRQTFEYLKRKYSGRVTCLSSHPAFLMVLLRIADYLEMDGERINNATRKLHALRSPISEEEWDAHLSVREVRMPDEGDLEAAFVFAVPGSSEIFLKLRLLLGGLQSELDLSWAVLGEVFSRQGELRRVGIRLRRVSSNLNDPQAFLIDHKPDYFPLHAAFDTAGADLLKLLIKPLYGDHPEVGVRELLQNGIDAVRELEQIMADRGDPAMQTISRPDQEADVLIDIDYGKDGQLYCTVSDKGIGMTAETVRAYFLRAGASFRTSDAWLEQFAPEGTPKLARSGRFGIGSLAAFLMGDRVEIHSRHVDAQAQDAVYFFAGLADEQVSLQRRVKLDVGTTVRVHLSRQAAEVEFWRSKSQWDWYRLTKPLVHRRLRGVLLREWWTDEWSRDFNEGSVGRDHVTVPGLQGLWWHYRHREYTCNGITIKSVLRDSKKRHLRWPDRHVPFQFPGIHLLEGARQVPLSLTRFDFEEEMPFFVPDLLADLTREFCAFLLALAPKTSVDAFQLNRLGLFVKERWHIAGSLFPIVCLPEGFSVLHPWHACAASGRLVRILDFSLIGVQEIRRALASLSSPYLCVSGIDFGGEGGFPLQLLKSVAFRIWRVPEVRVDRRRPHYYGKGRLLRPSAGGLRAAARGVLTREPPELLKACASWLREASLGSEVPEVPLVEVQLGEIPTQEATSPFARIWQELLGDPVIPYDQTERERKFPRAFDLLRDRIEHWQSPSLDGWRRMLRERLERLTLDSGTEIS